MVVASGDAFPNPQQEIEALKCDWKKLKSASQIEDQVQKGFEEEEAGFEVFLHPMHFLENYVNRGKEEENKEKEQEKERRQGSNGDSDNADENDGGYGSAAVVSDEDGGHTGADDDKNGAAKHHEDNDGTPFSSDDSQRRSDKERKFEENYGECKTARRRRSPEDGDATLVISPCNCVSSLHCANAECDETRMTTGRKLLVCIGCHEMRNKLGKDEMVRAFYCGTECQAADWLARHKEYHAELRDKYEMALRKDFHVSVLYDVD